MYTPSYATWYSFVSPQKSSASLVVCLVLSNESTILIKHGKTRWSGSAVGQIKIDIARTNVCVFFLFFRTLSQLGEYTTSSWNPIERMFIYTKKKHNEQKANVWNVFFVVIRRITICVLHSNEKSDKMESSEKENGKTTLRKKTCVSFVCHDVNG